MALTFLLAYLFFNDGIQTVIASASMYGAEELEFEHRRPCSATFLLVQFVAFGGALCFGRAAGRYGAKPVILGGLGDLDGDRHRGAVPARRSRRRRSCCWASRSASCWAAPRRWPAPTSSLLIPRGKEAEYFSFYHAMDRGTSWFGTLVFGAGLPAHRLLPAGDLRADRVLRRRRRCCCCGWTPSAGIREAGNDVPPVV